MLTKGYPSAGGLVGGRLSRREFILRALGAGVSLSAAGALLSACGGGTQSPGAAQSITFIGAWEQSTLASVIEGFKKSHPDFKITNTNYPFEELNSVLQSRLQSQDSDFDCYAADQPRVPGFAARGFLADLSDMAGEVQEKALKPQYEASSWNGKLYSLPMWTSELVLYYNRELLEKAGIDPPSIDPQRRWTWEETVSAAKETQKAGAKWGIVFAQVNRYYQLQPLPESLGGGPGLTGPHLLEPAITNEEWVRAFEWYRSLFSDGLSPRGIPPEQTFSLFVDGDLTFYVGGVPPDPTFEEAKAKGKIDWGVAPHPYFANGEPITATDSWSLGINPFSEKQDAALEFIKYPSLTTEGALRSLTVPVLPANAEAFQKYTEELSNSPTLEPKGVGELVTYELENTAVHRPRTIGYVQFEEAMNKAFTDISNGADPRNTFQRTSNQLNSDFEPLRRALEQRE